MDVRKKCLIPRFGLRELVHLNGLVRTLCSRSIDVMLVVNRSHVSPLRHLFADTKNLRFTFLKDWSDVYKTDVIASLQTSGYEIITLPSFRDTCPYTMLGEDPALARTEFWVHRDEKVERWVYDTIVGVSQPYIVVYQCPDKRIRTDLLPKGYRIIELPVNANPFDWIRVLDHAVQFHAVDSGALLIADIMCLRPQKFFHSYASHDVPTRYHDVVTVR